MRYVASLVSGVGIFCVGAGLSVYHGIKLSLYVLRLARFILPFYFVRLGVTGIFNPDPIGSFYWVSNFPLICNDDEICQHGCIIRILRHSLYWEDRLYQKVRPYLSPSTRLKKEQLPPAWVSGNTVSILHFHHCKLSLRTQKLNNWKCCPFSSQRWNNSRSECGVVGRHGFSPGSDNGCMLHGSCVAFQFAYSRRHRVFASWRSFRRCCFLYYLFQLGSFGRPFNTFKYVYLVD